MVNKEKSLIKPFFSISPKNAGVSSIKKIRQIKNILFKNKVDYLLVTAPENVAWVLNIRGYDSAYSPVPNARLLISKNGEVNFFTNPKKLKEIKKIKMYSHDERKIENVLNRLSRKNIWLDSLSCSFFYKSLLGRKKTKS